MPEALGERRRAPGGWWLLVSAGVIGLDQLTKWLIQQTLSLRAVDPRCCLSSISCYVYNPGAAFSFLSTRPGWQRDLFVAIALAASALIVYLLRQHAQTACSASRCPDPGRRRRQRDRPRAAGGGGRFPRMCMLARITWPAFNLADSAITCGAGLLIWDSLRRPRVGQAQRP